MELRDFLRIFGRQWKLLASIVVIAVLLGEAVYAFQTPSMAADLTLNIGRTGVQQTNEYRYDSFYRLQADERFSDTVVRWIGSARVLEDITQAANTSFVDVRPWRFGAPVSAERLSSQVIHVTFRAHTVPEADHLAKALIATINHETEQLNGSGADEAWFTVQAEAPVVTDGRLGIAAVIGTAFVLGIFVAFWVGLFRYYWYGKREFESSTSV